MRPAMEAVLFSAVAGAGYGLTALLGTFRASGLLPGDRWFGLAGMGLALAAVGFGLWCAARHGGGAAALPRTLSRWRTSWSSRTAVLAAAASVPAVLFAYGWVALENTGGAWRWFGLIAASFSIMTVYCAAMVHASRTRIPAWSNRWTLPNHLALALLAGALWLNALTRAFGFDSPDIALLAVVALFLAFYLKRKYWRLIDADKAAVAAGGLPGPGTGDGIGRDAAARLRRIAFLGLFALPLLLTLVGLGNAPSIGIVCTAAAALSATGGLVVERWLFFAEASTETPVSAADGV